jgi:hypothetical protein
MVEFKQESNFVRDLQFWQAIVFTLVFHAGFLLLSYSQERILAETNDVLIPYWGHRSLSLPYLSHHYF